MTTTNEVREAVARNQQGPQCCDACVLALEVMRLQSLLEHFETLPAQRYTRAEVDHELELVEHAARYNHKVPALTAVRISCEVRSLRAQYVLARKCATHGCSMHVGADGLFTCWQCDEGQRMRAQLQRVDALPAEFRRPVGSELCAAAKEWCAQLLEQALRGDQ